MNEGAFEAATATGSPVCGLRAVRAARLRVANFPNPAMATGSPRARASPMVEPGALAIPEAI